MRKAVAFAHLAPEHSGAVNGAAPSASSRITQLGRKVKLLKEKAGEVLESLLPDAPVPGALYDLASRLNGAPAAIEEQVEMAARGGSDMALALVLS